MSSKLEIEIQNISNYPGMYVGPSGVWEIEDRLNDIANYINGILHGASLFSNVSNASWREWVQKQYKMETEPLWEKILLSEFGSVEAILKNLTSVFIKYENDQK